MDEGALWRQRAAELASALRAAIDALSTRQVGADTLAEATESVRRIVDRLDGPARARWYEHEASDPAASPQARGAYSDQSPIRGLMNPIAPPLAVEVVTDDDGQRRAVGHVRLSRSYEGPPHGVHGGWVAALFDDLLGHLQGAGGPPGVTARLEVRYRDLTPIETDLRLEGWIESDDGRRVVARASCHAGDLLTAEAEALFIRVDFAALQERMGGGRSDGSQPTAATSGTRKP